MFEPVFRSAMLAKPTGKGPGGHSRFHPLHMFKVLVLQRLNSLADDTTSFPINDRNRCEDNELIKEGDVPSKLVEASKVRAHKDLDARWTKRTKRTKKYEQTFYGYKGHVKVDVMDKFTIKAVVRLASVPDSQVIAELVEDGDRVVCADTAYKSAKIETDLAAKKAVGQINVKRTRGHPLSEKQKAINCEKSKTRSRVEHVFGQMIGSMKVLYQRCIGKDRNAAGLKLTNLVYNLLRFEQINRLGLNGPE